MVEDYQHYEYFMDEFGSLVVGRGGFHVRSRERVPEKWLSVAGEAFVLMSIENYIEWVTAEVLEDAPPPSRRESLANGVTTAMLQDTKVLKRRELRDTRSCSTK